MLFLKVVKYLLTDGRLDPNVKDEILQVYCQLLTCKACKLFIFHKIQLIGD